MAKEYIAIYEGRKKDPIGAFEKRFGEKLIVDLQNMSRKAYRTEPISSDEEKKIREERYQQMVQKNP